MTHINKYKVGAYTISFLYTSQAIVWKYRPDLSTIYCNKDNSQCALVKSSSPIYVRFNGKNQNKNYSSFYYMNLLKILFVQKNIWKLKYEKL